MDIPLHWTCAHKFSILFIADSVEPLCVFHVLGQLDDTYQKRSGKQRRQPEVALQFQRLIIVAVALNWNKIQTKLNCKSQIFVPFFFFTTEWRISSPGIGARGKKELWRTKKWSLIPSTVSCLHGTIKSQLKRNSPWCGKRFHCPLILKI